MNIFDSFQAISSRLLDTVSSMSDFLNTLSLPIIGNTSDDEVQSVINNFSPQTILFENSESFTISDIANNEMTIIHHYLDESDIDVSEQIDIGLNDLDDSFNTAFTSAVFHGSPSGIRSMNDLLTTVKSAISTNSVVSQITNLYNRVTDDNDSVTASDIINLIDSKIDESGRTKGLSVLKNYFVAAGGKISNFEWANCLTSLYQRASNALGNNDISGFNDVMPTVDEFNWAVIPQIASTLAQVVGAALLGVSKVIGVIVQLLGSVINLAATAIGGRDTYSKNRAINCYLNIPIIARSTSSSGSNYLRKFSSPFCDYYTWRQDNVLYENAFLKPCIHSEGNIPFFVHKADDPTGIQDRGVNVFGQITIGAQAFFATYNGLDIEKNKPFYSDFSSIVNDIDGSLTGYLHLGFATSLFMICCSALAGREYWFDNWPTNASGQKVPIFALPNLWQTLSDTVLTKTDANLYEIMSALISILIFGSTPESDIDAPASIFTKSLSNCIKSFRNLTVSHTVIHEFFPLVGVLEITDDAHITEAIGWNINNDECPEWFTFPYNTAPALYLTNYGTTWGFNEALSYYNAVNFNPIKSPQWANCLTVKYAISYCSNNISDYSSMSSNEVLNLIAIENAYLPTKYTYTYPTASFLGKWLTFAAVTAAVAVAVIGTMAGINAIKNKYQKFQLKKIKQLEEMHNNVDPSDPTSIANYHKAIKRYNLINKFLPGNYSFNATSGWAEQISSGSSDSQSSLSDTIGSLSGFSSDSGVSLDSVLHVITG